MMMVKIAMIIAIILQNRVKVVKFIFVNNIISVEQYLSHVGAHLIQPCCHFWGRGKVQKLF